MRMRHFWVQNGPFAHKSFFEKIIFHQPIGPFHCAKFKKHS